MVKKLWDALGRITFWASWPALFVYLYNSKRTRVIVSRGNKVLAVKGWFSAGQWDLPGGGLHKGENAAHGAARELYEETAVSIKSKHLEHLRTERVKSYAGLRYVQIGFGVSLDKQPLPKRQKFEITEAVWVPWQKIFNHPKTSPDIKSLIETWFKT